MPEILGIGTDIEEPRRFQKHLTIEHVPDDLLRAVFTPEEIRCNTLNSSPLLCFTLGFCCKEAVFKAVGRSWMNAPISWQDIELLFTRETSLDDFEIKCGPPVQEMITRLGAGQIKGDFQVNPEHVIFNVFLMSTDESL